ncbi:MAG: UDP-N-acetylmuramoyl-L-alanyl-D-glutamate--2,6-diaminopimelate ligase [Betaproteobacteria bacterium]
MSVALRGRAVADTPPATPSPALRALRALSIRRLVTDSRAVQPGDTFVAFPGETRDGREYIGQAIARGAASVLWEKRGYAWRAEWRVPNAGVVGLRRRAGEIASLVYGRPSAKLWMIGVTGTNGKTSCSQWIAQSLTRCGTRCAVIGTLGNGFPGRLEAGQNTTPDAVSLHAALRDFVEAGAGAASMEVSSHGLVQHRLSGVEFDVALLTNLTRDHLDYHGTMRAYRSAKSRLFQWPSLTWVVLNLDDPFGLEQAARLRDGRAHVIGYGFRSAHAGRGPRNLLRVQGRNLHVGSGGLSFEVTTPWGRASLSSRLIGRFNASNLLATLAVLLASDTSLDAAVCALERVRALPGRTERHGGGRAPLVLIDYAHTPDALEQVLKALRETMPLSRRTASARASRRHARLICVFGCGGERDRGKRALMGTVASRLADQVIITSDNPRGEDPLAIIDDIARGACAGEVIIEPDRTQAIRLAVHMAAPGDVVLVAGKGHEQYQEVAGVKHPYSDATEVTNALRTRRGGAPWR